MAVSELVNRTIRHPAFQVTGRGTDVAFVIDSDASFEDVTGDLRAYLVANGGMFSSGNITVDVGSRLLFQEEIAGIRRIIETHSGLTVSRFWCAADALESGSSRREPGPSAVQPSAAQPSAVPFNPRSYTTPRSPSGKTRRERSRVRRRPPSKNPLAPTSRASAVTGPKKPF